MTAAIAAGAMASDYGGHPATAILAFLLVLSVASARPEPAANGAEALGEIFGGAFFGALLWGIGYAITIRHASPGWKVASVIILVILGGFASVMRLGAQHVSERQDAVATRKQLSAMMADPNLTSVKPAEGAGPLARISALTVGMMRTDAKAFADERTASGLDQVISFEG